MKPFYLLLSSCILLVSCNKNPGKLQMRIDQTVQAKDVKALKLLQQEVQTKIQTLNNASKTLSDALLSLGVGVPATTFVGFETVQRSNFRDQVEVSGEVASDRNIMISSEISGILKQLHVAEGKWVKKGTLLATLDDGGLADQLKNLKAQLALAKTLFERQDRLWKDKIGSEVEYLQAKTNKETLQSSVNQTKKQLKKTKIVAPFSGYIDDILPKKGEFMSPGSPLLRLIDDTNLYVTTYVPESFLGKIEVGASVDLQLSTLGTKFKGTVSKVSQHLQQNRNFEVDIRIDQEYLSKLTISQMVKAFITIKELNDVIVLDKHLVTKDNMVFILKNINQGRATLMNKKILLGPYSKTHVVVQSGITEGEHIVNTGNKGLRDGQLVKLVE